MKISRSPGPMGYGWKRAYMGTHTHDVSRAPDLHSQQRAGAVFYVHALNAGDLHWNKPSLPRLGRLHLRERDLQGSDYRRQGTSFRTDAGLVRRTHRGFTAVL